MKGKNKTVIFLLLYFTLMTGGMEIMSWQNAQDENLYTTLDRKCTTITTTYMIFKTTSTTTETTTSDITTTSEAATTKAATTETVSTTETTNSTATVETIMDTSTTTTETTTTEAVSNNGLTFVGTFKGTYYSGGSSCKGGSGRELIGCSLHNGDIKGSVACRFIYSNYGYNRNERTKIYIESPIDGMTGWYYVDDCCKSNTVVDFYYNKNSECPFQKEGRINVKVYI